jgi:WD40 repeat protein
VSTLFISYSSRDRDRAVAVKQRLEAWGYQAPFLDYHPEDGIPPGTCWEVELRRRVATSRAVIVLCTPASMASMWCFAEIQQALALDRPVFPVELEPCVRFPTLERLQVVSTALDEAGAWASLKRGLETAGVSAGDDFALVPGRSPYPGLRAFDELDAAVFVGREPEIGDVMSTIDMMRDGRCPPITVVLGASGCGKSSLIRAGILPRLRKDPARWRIVGPMRPGADPLAELGRQLGATTAPMDALIGLAGAQGATGAVLLVIDQVEELYVRAAGRAAAAFLASLHAALSRAHDRLFVLGSVHSDLFDRLQTDPSLDGRAIAVVPLGRLPQHRLFDVITVPAAHAGITMDTDLPSRLVELVPTTDALPLLAFALERMYTASNGRHLGLADLTRAGSSLEHHLERVAERLVAGIKAAGVAERRIEQLFLGLVATTRVDGAWRTSSRPLALDEVPGELRPMIDAFIGERLFVNDEGRVEVAHEALLRSWPRLRGWIERNSGLLDWCAEIRVRAERHRRGEGGLLDRQTAGARRRWKDSWQAGLDADERTYVTRSLRQLRARHLASCVLSLVAAAVAISLILMVIYAEDEKAFRWDQEVISLVQEQGWPKNEDSLTRLLRLELHAVHRPDEVPITTSLLFRHQVPWVVAYHSEAVTAMALSPDGRLVASADEGGEVRISPASGRGPQRVFRIVRAASRLRFSSDGARLFIGYPGGLAWIEQGGAGPVEVSLPYRMAVHSIAFPLGDSVAVIGSRLHVVSLGREPTVHTVDVNDVGALSSRAQPAQRWDATDRRALLIADRFTATVVSLEDGVWGVTSRMSVPGQIRAAAMSPDGLRVAVQLDHPTELGIDEEVVVLDVARAQRRALYRVRRGLLQTTGLAFSPDSSVLATTTTAGTKLWSVVPSEDEPFHQLGDAEAAWQPTFGPGARSLVVSNADSGETMWPDWNQPAANFVLPAMRRNPWDFSQEQPPFRMRVDGPAILWPILASDGTRILTGHGHTVAVWQPRPAKVGRKTWAEIATEVRSRTTACQTPRRRLRYEKSWSQAVADYEACERSYDRVPTQSR